MTTPTAAPTPPTEEPNSQNWWELASQNVMHVNGTSGIAAVVALVSLILGVIAFVGAVNGDFDQRRKRRGWGWFWLTIFVLAGVFSVLIAHDPTLFGLLDRLHITLPR